MRGGGGGGGFRSMADSPHIELGIGLGFQVSAFLSGPNFNLYKRIFHRIKKKDPNSPNFELYKGFFIGEKNDPNSPDF